MSVREAIRVAMAGLLANRLRSALTMLGVVIGVSAVILLVAFGNGAGIEVQRQVQALGSNIVYVYPSNARTAGVSQGFGSGQTLTDADVKALNDPAQAPDLVAAVPVTGAPGTLQYRDQNWQAQTSGSTQDYAQVRNYQVAAGSFFTAADVENSARVVVLGATVVDNLFAGDPTSAVGQTIKIQRQPFRVVGTFVPKGSNGLGNQDNVAVVPITAAWNYLLGGRGKYVGQIILEARDSASVGAEESEATQILLTRHRIADPSQADFQMLSQQDILAAVGQITGVLTLLLGAIAAISLVVGGIGIMNIMLVTVTERTKEIGIRKAVGARRWDVLMQFVIESMVLAGLGGLLGVGIGAGFAWLVGQVVREAGSTFPPPVVSMPSVALAFGVSLGIGLFFGIYPANRAAALSPIEALRYE
jgi:putative ABC transport system permease protein